MGKQIVIHVAADSLSVDADQLADVIWANVPPAIRDPSSPDRGKIIDYLDFIPRKNKLAQMLFDAFLGPGVIVVTRHDDIPSLVVRVVISVFIRGMSAVEWELQTNDESQNIYNSRTYQIIGVSSRAPEDESGTVLTDSDSTAATGVPGD